MPTPVENIRIIFVGAGCAGRGAIALGQAVYRNERSSELPARCESRLDWRALAACSTERARACIPFDAARAELVLPLTVLESAPGVPLMTVAVADAPTQERLQRLRFLSGMDVVCETVERAALSKAVYSAYRGTRTELESKRSSAELSIDDCSLKAQSGTISTAPVPMLLDSIVDRALLLNATDIHLEPRSDGCQIRFRVDGVLRQEAGMSFSPKVGRALVRRIRVLCKLEGSERDPWQEGGFSFNRAEWHIRLRVSVLKGVAGNTVVLRLLDNSFLDQCRSDGGRSNILAQLGMDAYQQGLVYACIGRGSGTILAAGPTGCGKSTLLYALLALAGDGTKKVITIEDPVERIVEGAVQLDVSKSSEWGFADLLKAGLRQDPDIVLVGEIRDAETARTALDAGTTGHLVFSSIHSSSAAEAAVRLLGMHGTQTAIADSLRMIISPRLIPKVCRGCAEAYEEQEKLLRYFDSNPNAQIRKGRGCSACRRTGCSGVASVFEFFLITQAVRDQMKLDGDSARIALAGRAQYQNGRLVPLREQVLELLFAGQIDPHAALRVLGIAPQLLGLKAN